MKTYNRKDVYKYLRNNEKTPFYVYALINPITMKPFYIGKGTGRRAVRHIENTDKSNPHKYHTIEAIKRAGYKDVLYNILYLSDREIDAYNKEQEIIYEIGIENLTNMQTGGKDNQSVMTSEIREKISKTNKKIWSEIVIEDLNKVKLKNKSGEIKTY